MRKKYIRSPDGERRRMAGLIKAVKGKKLTKEHIAKIVATKKKNGSYVPWNKNKIFITEAEKKKKSKIWHKEYRNSERGRTMINNYHKTEKYKRSLKGYSKKWMDNGGREWKRIWRRKYAKIEKARRKNMKFIEIMSNPFPDNIKMNWHHINDIFVIPMPELIHLKNSGRRIGHRIKCNNILNNWGFKLNNFDGS